ncbi:MAG: hypothetical protein Q9170_003107 [Blastenia crenularia]
MVYLGKRETYPDDNNIGDGDGGWWYSDSADAIKWAVVAAIFFGIALFFAGGYLHARRRVRRNQAPLRYHRNPYEMQAYPPPPPIYSSSDSTAYHQNDLPPPPRYEAPQGASKTNPDQQYAAPPGPPPAAVSPRSSPPSPVSPLQERTDPLRQQFNEGRPQQHEEAHLPPRPQASHRSWNPLKRFK